MKYSKISRRARLGTAFGALTICLGSVTMAQPAAAQARTYRPSGTTVLSIGEGQVVNLSNKISDVWVSNPEVADVHVSNSRQMNVFGKKAGEATVIATAADGSTVYATSVRVSQNLSSVNDVLRAAMPESDIEVMTIGQVAVLSGTVASPSDAAHAQAIVTSYLNPGKKEGDALDILPINRLRTATPLQVNLRVKIAEVNRSFVKEIGVNLLTQDSTGGFRFGVAQGEGISVTDGSVLRNPIGTTLRASGNLFGLDIISRLALAETDGLVTTLAEPNLTALSGETASFLAGGEFPVPIAETGLGGISVEFKEYGVSLAFTPIVLADGRISMRVRPEVSELTNEGSIRIGELFVPGLTTRRAETTVELGSGQSFMIGGLLRNSNNNDIDKAPFLGDLPILGALFRSTKYRRAETELVIIVTPYLVRPVSTRMALPTDGYRAPTTPQMVFEGQTYTGTSGPRPTSVTPVPAVGIPVGGAAATTAAPGFKL